MLPARRVAVVVLLSPGLSFAAEDSAKPPFTVSRQTTWVTSPLTKSGYVDYAAAINRRLGRGVTAKNNSNVLLWQAHGPHPERATMPAEFFKLMGMKSPKEKGDYFLHLGKFLKERAGVTHEHPEFNKILDNQSAAAQRPWKKQDYPRIAAWLAANQKPLRLVTAAAMRKRYFSPWIVPEKDVPGGLIAVLLPAVQSARSFARALTARAMLHLAEGRTQAAWQDLLTCHRLARSVAQGPSLIEGLVGVALESMAAAGDVAFLQHAKLDDQQIARCLADLQKLPPLPAMVDKINLSERCTFLDVVAMLAAGKRKDVAALIGDDAPPLPEFPAAAVDWDAVLKHGNRWYDRLVAVLREDRQTMLEEMAEIHAELKRISAAARKPFDPRKLDRKQLTERVGSLMVSLLLPALAQARHAEDRAVQRHRNLQVAFALAAYRHDHKRYPPKLADLSPRYLKKIPGDLFAAKPLIYKPAGKGYLLYSVGFNGKDDAGRESAEGGDDIALRMQ